MSVTVHSATDLIFATANLPTATSFTAFLWLKLTTAAAGTDRRTLGLNDSGPSHLIGLTDNTTNTYQLLDNAGGVVFGSTPTVTGWFNTAITCSGTGAGSLIGYWRNNADVAYTTASSAGVTFTPTEFDFFNFGGTAVAEIAFGRVWSVVLTPTELNAEFLSSTVVKTANLMRNIPLVNAATAGNDISGNGFNMTIFGSPTDGASLPTFPTTGVKAAAEYYYGMFQ